MGREEGRGESYAREGKSRAWFRPSTHLLFDNLPELSLVYNNKNSLPCVVCPLSFYDCNLNIRSL